MTEGGGREAVQQQQQQQEVVQTVEQQDTKIDISPADDGADGHAGKTEKAVTTEADDGNGGHDRVKKLKKNDNTNAATVDQRWCSNSEGRIGEFGVIGAEQADESHFDDRSRGSTDTEDGDGDGDGKNVGAGGARDGGIGENANDGGKIEVEVVDVHRKTKVAGNVNEIVDVDGRRHGSSRRRLSSGGESNPDSSDLLKVMTGTKSNHSKRNQKNDDDEVDEPTFLAGHLSAEGRIKFSKKKSYGREKELQLLLDAYRSNCDFLKKRHHMELISGGGRGRTGGPNSTMNKNINLIPPNHLGLIVGGGEGNEVERDGMKRDDDRNDRKMKKHSSGKSALTLSKPKTKKKKKLQMGGFEKNLESATTISERRRSETKMMIPEETDFEVAGEDDGDIDHDLSEQPQHHRQQDGQKGGENDETETAKTVEDDESSSTTALISRTPCTTFISGFSGSGKSTLVDEMVRRLRDGDSDRDNMSDERGGLRFMFLRAKYSQQRRTNRGRTSIVTTPYGALGSLFHRIKDELTVEELKRKFSTQFNDTEMEAEDLTILARIFPGLSSMLVIPDSVGSTASSLNCGTSGPFSTGTPAANSSDHDSDHRSMSGSSDIGSLRSGKTKLNKAQVECALQTFFEVLTSESECPLILFLDDLQWADYQSLSFLTKLLTNQNLPGLFFIGAYRSNEVNPDHALITAINDVKKEKEETGKEEVPVLTLDLSEWTMEDTGQFIADTLKLDPEQVQPLTQAVYTKTFGNPFFTRQALEQLVRKNVLYYDTITFEWSWNLSSQQELENIISDDIEEMVKNKIEHLSLPLQQVLVVASCISNSGDFDVDTLLEVLHAAKLPALSEGDCHSTRLHLTRIDLVDLLDIAVTEGLLLRILNAERESYSFSHDRIEEAAQHFMSELFQKDVSNEYQMLLFKIGMSLYDRAQSAQGEDWMYFSAAHRLNSIRSSASIDQNGRGSSIFLSLSREQELHLAELNQRTAELSLELLAFNAAAEFCQFGLQDLLGDCGDDEVIWETQYDLILSLYTVGAESEYSAGNIDKALSYCEKILTHQPRNIYDFLPAYKVKLDSLGGKKKGTGEIFDLSFWVCEQLGFKFPKSKTLQKVAAWAALRTARAKYIPTVESIKGMGRVTDPILIETFDMLMTAGSIAFQVLNMHLYVLVAVEGLKFMNQYGLTDGSASAISSFANALMHMYGDFDTSARLGDLSVQLAKLNTNKFNQSRPLNTSGMFVLGWVRPLRSLLPLHVQAQEAALTSGNTEGVGVSKSFMTWNMMYSAVPLSSLESFCRKGVPELRKKKVMFDASLVCMTWQTALNLMGKTSNPTVMVGEAMDDSSPPYCDVPFAGVVAVWRRYLYLIYGEFEMGADAALATGDAFESGVVRGLMYGLETFVRGMLLFGMARKCNDAVYRKSAMQILQRLKEWVTKGCVNLIGPMKLLKAEKYALLGNTKAINKFEQAISICREGKFHQFAGLSHERYATYLIEHGLKSSAREHFNHAIECYRRWGATGKVERLMITVGKFSETESSGQSGYE